MTIIVNAAFFFELTMLAAILIAAAVSLAMTAHDDDV